MYVVIFICMATSSWIQSSGGQVAVSKIVLPTQNGQSLAATLFKPISATSDTPAPFVAVVPGFQKDPERHYLISRSNSHEEVLL